MDPSRLARWLAPGLCAALALLLHLFCGERYGPFRDELYFVACGRRLAFGYVDQPPLIALVARLAWWLSGEARSLTLFRLPAMICHAGTALVAAALARRLGTGPFAPALATLAVAVAPIQLAQGHLLTMNTFELLLWASICLASLGALQGQRRRWLLAGALLGLALLTKYSAAMLALALLAGLALTRSRAALRSPWLWGGVGIAAALVLPSLLWQLQHGLRFLELLRNGQRYKNAPIPPLTLLRESLLEQGPATALLSLAGLGWLLRARAAAGARWLGVALLLLLAGMTLLHAKPYYLAPAFTPLFAAGAVALERATASRWARALAVVLVVATAAPAVPLSMPLLPLPRMLAWQGALGLRPTHLERLRYTDVPQHFADQLGWRERVAAVEAVVQVLPAAQRERAVIFTNNYGRAAALELLGRGLPPVICGHNQYFLWGVPGDPQVVVALGGDRGDYQRDFSEVTRAGQTPPVPDGMPYESEVPIFVLRGPRAPVRELFLSARHFE